MAEIIGNVRGMRDLLDEDSRTKNNIELITRELAFNYGYQEICTPIVENQSVFKKTLGDTSDIVIKEMYNFKDEKGRNLTLRPEATAGIARAIVSNGLLGSGEYRIPLKFFLVGPMFRYERPQKGRYRQFNQINFEFFNDALPEIDVELISLAYNFLKKIGAPTNLVINSLGDEESRKKYKLALVAYLNNYKKKLTEDSKIRLYKNPLRILDTKNKEELKILNNAPKIIDFLTLNSKEYFKKVKFLLEELDINFLEDTNLVRGLDYYKETVFEFKTNQLGQQQDTVLGGGRYSGLVKMFGGEDLDGSGWAAGIDRLIDISKKEKKLPPKVSIVFDAKFKDIAIKLANLLRNSKKINGYIDIIYSGSIQKQIKRAGKLNAQSIILVENEKNVKITDKTKKIIPLIAIKEIDKIIKIINVN